MVRTRFAPSPTGYLHVGGLRTALYSYLYARQNKGRFLLRIEDTDQKRYVEGAVESLINTLTTVGISFDEGPGVGGDHGPYIQSERTEMYREHAQKLIELKAAYPCFCTAERLVQMRERQTAAKKAPMYDRTCLNLSASEIEEKKKAGTPFVIRQKIPHGRKVQFKDHVRGVVSFETSTVDDQVLMKSDNFPTYHLANVVDDHFMQITHVIRGEEWLPSTPKHLLLYEAFGWTPPEYAHLPLLLNKDKSKLSKRQGDVSVESYLEKGYSKEALINFVALLGWHPGAGIEKEIFSMEELI
ncbi:MAG TPA: glutamate--tRNA ligase, partial [Candidatus Gracilibacteria bacterium]|nr:glutamate--tRNA ligase [Candidatus Gracilibacteria bacterium]